MRLLKITGISIMWAILFVGIAAYAHSNSSDALQNIKHEWAKVEFTLKGDEQQRAYQDLLKDIVKLVKQHPKQAEVWVWRGIIESSYAGVKEGVSALKLAKKAKKSLERSLHINDSALGGAAYISLGALYYRVPGKPISFGDDNKAERLLKKALQFNPNGMDANFFYGEYLFKKHKYDEAKKYLLIAKNATAQMERPLVDKHRRLEIDEVLAKVNKELVN
ncbi:tetratricopeptide repeat protein [Flocculibacter collagenilyticus]|uniref:tetratricopeptide repeat protein n=1 Tax=Flocculibacter collagenilyticus TaxID=2744479 RepID=UPI0018F62C8B|nr:hypothetical protein [Flocculibacter collagenilyticus]